MSSLATSYAPEAAREDVVISLAAPSDHADWDRYVAGHEGGRFFHLSGWGEAIEAAYGYEPLYLCARRGAAIVGLLPLIDVRASLLGRSLVSTGFTIGGGPIGDEEGVLRALCEKAAVLGEERGVQYVELRGGNAAPTDWVVKSGKYASFEAPIPADEDDNLKAIPRKRRAELRKAIAAQEAGELNVCCGDDLDGFYKLYANSLRAHGTPIFPKKFLHALANAFRDKIEISFVERHGEAIAGLVSFYFKDRVLPYYVGAASDARDMRAHDLLYWSLMRRAAARGAAVFDFGRSKEGSGPYRYKQLWGMEPRPLSYQYKLIGAKALPDVNPNNPKFKYFTKAWKLLPLPAANFLGPLVASNFP